MLLADTALVVDFDERPEPYEELYERIAARLPDGSVESPFKVVKVVAAQLIETHGVIRLPDRPPDNPPKAKGTQGSRA